MESERRTVKEKKAAIHETSAYTKKNLFMRGMRLEEYLRLGEQEIIQWMKKWILSAIWTFLRHIRL